MSQPAEVLVDEIDPEIARVREARHRISERFGHDPYRLVAHYMERQADRREGGGRSLQVDLVMSSEREFLELLETNRVEFVRYAPPIGVVMASAGTTIEVLHALSGASPWAALATILIAWIRGRTSRKVYLLIEGPRVECLVEGMSVTEIERLLEKARNVTAVDTQRPG